MIEGDSPASQRTCPLETAAGAFEPFHPAAVSPNSGRNGRPILRLKPPRGD
jgi:hypothetical protein